MKKLFTLLAGMLFTTLAFAQTSDGITICHTPAIEKFALCFEQGIQQGAPEAARVYTPQYGRRNDDYVQVSGRNFG
jgi:hypothetical protein